MLLGSLLAVWLNGVVVGGNYVTPKFRSWLGKNYPQTMKVATFPTIS
jgi:hypothetical protein